MKELTGNYTPGAKVRKEEDNDLGKLILTVVLLLVLIAITGLVQGIL